MTHMQASYNQVMQSSAYTEGGEKETDHEAAEDGKQQQIPPTKPARKGGCDLEVTSPPKSRVVDQVENAGARKGRREGIAQSMLAKPGSR